MNSKQLNSKLAFAIKRYRIASLRLLAMEDPSFDFSSASTASDESAFCFLEAMGDVFVFQKRRKSPSQETIMRCVATQEFLCLDTKNRSLLGKNDVKHLFPSLYRTGLPRGYYVDSSSETPRLGLLRIDSKLLPVRRIKEKTIRQFEKHRKDAAFGSLIGTNQFSIHWLLPTQAKVDALRLLFKQKKLRVSVEANVSQSLLRGAIHGLTHSPMSRV